MGPAPFMPTLGWVNRNSGIYTIRFSAEPGRRRERFFYHPGGGNLAFQEDKLSSLSSFAFNPDESEKHRRFLDEVGFGRLGHSHVPSRFVQHADRLPEELRMALVTFKGGSLRCEHNFAAYKSRCVLSFLESHPVPEWLPRVLEAMVSSGEYGSLWKEYCVQYLGLLALCHPDVDAATCSGILAYLPSLLDSREGAIAGTAFEILAEAVLRRDMAPPVPLGLLRSRACATVCDETATFQSRVLAFDVAMRLGASKRDFPKNDLLSVQPPDATCLLSDYADDNNFFKQIFDTIPRTVATLNAPSGVLLFCR